MKSLIKYNTTFKDTFFGTSEIQEVEVLKHEDGKIFFKVDGKDALLRFNSLDSFKSDFQECVEDGDFEFERIAYTEKDLETLYNNTLKNY